MNDWVQISIVCGIIAAAAWYVCRSLIGTFRTGKGAGSCCSKGCGGHAAAGNIPGSSGAAGEGSRPAVVREVFFPSELLYRKRK